MEEFLLEQKIPLLFVTHDRAFLRRMANRIIELDRGKLASWSCDYDTYLVRKEELFVAEERQRAAFDKKLGQEEAWSRRSPGARRTKSNARMEALVKMRAQRGAMRTATGSAKMEISEAERSGVRVVEAENIGFAYPGGQPLIRDFSLVLNRGDKVGLIGPNGAGKTTLVKMLLGQLAATSGNLKFGTKMEVVYLHNLADKHDTHVGCALRCLEAIRQLPKAERPRKAYGCEVWRDLDWLVDGEKTPMPVSARPELARALNEVFATQIDGGKRYDLAVLGRRTANATFSHAHSADQETAMQWAMDLTALIRDDELDPVAYVTGFIDRLKQDVISRLRKSL